MAVTEIKSIGRLWFDNNFYIGEGSNHENKFILLKRKYSWVFTGSIANLPASGTTQVSFGATGNIAPITMLKLGEIIGISITSTTNRTNGTVTVVPAKNGNPVLGSSVQLNAATPLSAFTEFTQPIQYLAGSRIGAQATSASWSPTTADMTITIWCRDL